MSNEPLRPRKQSRNVILAASLILIAWVILSRLPYVTDFESMGKDGPLYINSLALDETYSVPSPGNIGFVLLAKTAQLFWPEPVYAYAAVSILISAIGIAFVFLFATQFLPTRLAFSAALAFSCDAVMWWHGIPIHSYPVWIIALSAIAFFGTRYFRHRNTSDLILASLSLGLCSIARNDVIVFCTPLWATCLLLGRTSIRNWGLAIAIVGVCCAIWFFATASIRGGPLEYLEIIRGKYVRVEAGGIVGRGVLEGLIRNSVKFTILLMWSSFITLIPFTYCVMYHRHLRKHWRKWIVFAAWLLPSMCFALFFGTFAGAQIFPLTILVYLGAAKGLEIFGTRRSPVIPIAGTLCIAGICTAQFTLTRLLPPTNQRNVILNVSFLKLSGTGLLNDYNYNLADFEMSSSLENTFKQIRHPDPVPFIPPRRYNVPSPPPL